jgi:hypothetical protein
MVEAVETAGDPEELWINERFAGYWFSTRASTKPHVLQTVKPGGYRFPHLLHSILARILPVVTNVMSLLLR